MSQKVFEKILECESVARDKGFLAAGNMFQPSISVPPAYVNTFDGGVTVKTDKPLQVGKKYLVSVEESA